VEVVFFGPGLNMLLKKNTAYEERLKQLADSGETEGLFPFTKQQEAGWAYIH
jgi:intracellular sulfur oxidation DsrE/DsrF family protein